MKSEVAVAAARIFVLYNDDFDVAQEAAAANEFFRCLIDIGRERNLHVFVDGSEEYEALVDVLEMLCCYGE